MVPWIFPSSSDRGHGGVLCHHGACPHKPYISGGLSELGPHLLSHPTPPHPTSVVFTPDHALSKT